MKFDPALLFPNNNRAAWYWCGMFTIAVLFIMVQPYLLISSYKKNERVVVMDDKRVFHVAPVLGLEDASELYKYIAIQAAAAFMNRNPHGFDNKVMFEQIYLKEARRQALEYAADDYRQYGFKQRNIHMKSEMARARILEMAPGRVVAQVLGPTIFIGKSSSNRDFIRTFDYKLKFRLVRNPYLSRCGRLPYVVESMEYEKREKLGRIPDAGG